jgi:mediator of RNA polymerase II transcription subunit 16, fungi type
VSEPTIYSQVKGTPDNPLVHLEWAPTNNPELAVFDSAGRVAILIFSITLNQPFSVKKWDNDLVDEMQAIAGCHWLPVAAAPPQQYIVMYGPAIKGANGYQYETSFLHAPGTSHPHPSRSALLCVTTGGTLKMFWMQWNNRLEETTIELESISTADEIVTHAAFASDKSLSVPLRIKRKRSC